MPHYRVLVAYRCAGGQGLTWVDVEAVDEEAAAARAAVFAADDCPDDQTFVVEEATVVEQSD